MGSGTQPLGKRTESNKQNHEHSKSNDVNTSSRAQWACSRADLRARVFEEKSTSDSKGENENHDDCDGGGGDDE